MSSYQGFGLIALQFRRSVTNLHQNGKTLIYILTKKTLHFTPEFKSVILVRGVRFTYEFRLFIQSVIRTLDLRVPIVLDAHATQFLLCLFENTLVCFNQVILLLPPKEKKIAQKFYLFHKSNNAEEFEEMVNGSMYVQVQVT